MLVLFETPAGYAVFKVLDEGKISSADLSTVFTNPEETKSLIKLKAFKKFENTAEALAGATAILEGKLDSGLKKFLKKELDEQTRLNEKLAIADAKLGSAIAKKLGIKVVSDSSIMELMRGIREQLHTLISGLSESDLSAMSLGLAHSLSRYKLKFSPDKVDTMIVQAIGLLDDLDKELNTYAMRVKEWFGWHFPEMSKLIVDNIAYAKCVMKMGGMRERCVSTSFEDILPEDLEQQLKEIAEISMGTEISESDILSVQSLCNQVLSLSEYRTQLYEYLKNRMQAIAPNLTTLVGELVGARLIAHAGSLLNLAKHPASTIQILGAEKALFRALKSKKDTPKYGLIYHASLVGQAGLKTKGKMARMVAAKAALATRVDALGDQQTPEGETIETSADLGIEQRAKLEKQLKFMEGKAVQKAVQAKSHFAKTNQASAPTPVSFVDTAPQPSYNASADNTEALEKKKEKKKDKSAKKSKEEMTEEEYREYKKAKKEKKRKLEEGDGAADAEKKKKKKKREEE